LKVSLLGIRCIPGRHGGGDTEAEETSVRLVKLGIDVDAYVRSKYYENGAQSSYKGINLKFTPTIETKNFGTPIHTLSSIVHLWFTNEKPDLIHLRGVGNALFILLLKPLGIPIILSVDGKDWDRQKWGYFARKMLLFAAWIGVKFVDELTVDSKVNQSYYESKFGRIPYYVSYGAESEIECDDEVLEKYGLKKEDYLLWVGIYKPEKNIKTLIKAFERIKTYKKLLLVGLVDKYADYYNECSQTTDERIIFHEPIYGDDINSIYSGAYLYSQPSYVEGTSPSLLRAMGAGRCVVVSNIPENLETTGSSGISFDVNDISDLADKLQSLVDNPDEVKSHGKASLDRVRDHYNWDDVAERTKEMYTQVLAAKKVKDNFTSK